MQARVWRYHHPCSQSREAHTWLGVLSLAILAMCLGSREASAAPLKTHTAKHPTPLCANASLRPAPTNLAAVDTATLCLLNRVRAASHLRPLRFNAPLQSVAASQARDMVRGDYFGDNSLQGLTPMQRILTSGYSTHARSVQAAQNIGWATGPLATPAGMVRAWMQSPPHRAIILTAAFRDIGVGVTAAAPRSLARGLRGATYTLELGERLLAAQPPR
jgi:uncharacterized protein YkwD